MRVDAHHHFWTISRGDYSWLNPELAPIYRDFTPDDLKPHIEKAGIEQTILVQAADTVAETEFMLSLADKTDFIAGVVGWVDMEAPDAITTLEKLARNPKLKGIRPMIQDIKDDDWILRPSLDKVFKALVAMGLRFDALVLPRHLPRLLTVLEKHPDLKCVINHCAKPALSTGELSEWSNDIAKIARNTGAFCKLSGLITEIGPAWKQKQLTKVSNMILDEFGANRVMFGSDWPVLNLASEYQIWVECADRMTSQLSDKDRHHIWGQTATDFYDLG